MALHVVSSSSNNYYLLLLVQSLVLKNLSSPCLSTLHPPLQLWCSHLSVSPLKEGFSLLLGRLKLGRVRMKCPGLYLLQELPVLLRVLRSVCDQTAGCGFAVHVEREKQVGAVSESVSECI